MEETDLQQQPLWQTVQRRAFTAWMNQHLIKRGVALEDLVRDLDTGVLLHLFLELFLDKDLKLKLTTAPKLRIQSIDNLNQVLTYIHRNIVPLVNASAEDFVDHNAKIVLGVIHQLYLNLMIKSIVGPDGKTAEEALLLWVREKTKDYDSVNIDGYRTGFNSGRAFLALVDAYVDDKSVFDFDKIATENAQSNLEVAFTSADDLMGVPRILEPTDFGEGITDERGVIIALSTYFHAFKLGEKEREKANKIKDLQKQLNNQTKNLEDSAQELDRLRRELDEQKARIQPPEIWNIYRDNPSSNLIPEITIPFSVEEHVLGSRYTNYHIKVFCLDKVWVTRRRYSEFDKLIDKIGRELKRKITNPKLPPKRIVVCFLLLKKIILTQIDTG